jgi:hypothetical protein
MFDGYWSADVVNEGERELKDVIFVLPNAALTCHWSEGALASTCARGREKAATQLGDLQPRERVRVFAWTSIEPGALYFDNVRLTHSSGIGDVSFRKPVSTFWQWWESKWLVVVFVTSLALLILVSWLSSDSRQRGEPRKSSVAELSTSNETTA